MEADRQLAATRAQVDRDGQVPELDERGSDERVLADRHGSARQSSLWGRRGKAAAPRDDVGDLTAVDDAREALVEVGVPGEHRVGPEAGRRAGAVDVVGEPGRAPVAESAETGGWWQARITAALPACRAGFSRSSSLVRNASCSSEIG